MFNAHNISSAGQALSYYSKDNYYTKDQTIDESEWYGKGAESLNLKGKVDPATFKELLGGNIEGTQLQKLEKDPDGNVVDKRRPGFDFTFSAPKSVSILSEVYGDRDLRQAHETAVKEAVDYMEKHFAQARVTADNKVERENTENLTVALFRHNTSRSLDPDTHTHAVVINATKDKEGKWRSLSNEEIYENQRLLGAIYNAKLAQEVVKLGYEIYQTDNKGNFDIKGIDRVNHIKPFSQRRTQIVESLKARGIDIAESDAAQREKATLMTRATKKEVDQEQLHEAWLEQSKALNIEGERLIQSARSKAGERVQAPGVPSQATTAVINDNQVIHSPDNDLSTKLDLSAFGLDGQLDGPDQSDKLERELISPPAKPDVMVSAQINKDAQKAMYFAIGHLSEREAVMDKNRILQFALEHQVGKVGIHEINAEFNRLQQEKILVGLTEKKFSTQRLAASEVWTIKHLKATRGTVKEVLTPESAHSKILEIEQKQGFNFSPGQHDAIKAALSANDRFVGVQGLAGTGKTTMLNGLRAIAEREGYIVKGMAGTGAASKTLAQETGIVSDTVAMFLIREGKLQQTINEKQEEQLKNEIWIVDESSFLGQGNVEKLMRLAQERDARVMFLGDKFQLAAIEAGKPFELMQRRMQTATMAEINRQKDSRLKEAVSIIVGQDAESRTGKVGEFTLKQNEKALDFLDRNGMVVEDDKDVYQSLLTDYAKLSPLDKDKTLIITPLNKDRVAINTMVRESKKTDGSITAEKSAEIYVSKNLTKSQMQHSQYYDNDDIVRFGRAYQQLDVEKDEYLTVIKDQHSDKLLLKNKNGKLIEWVPEKTKNVEVYTKEYRQVGIGDSIRFTRSNEQIKNGETAKVIDFKHGKVILQGQKGESLEYNDEDLKHWDYSYASTIYAAQGATKHHVMMLVKGGVTSEDQKESLLLKKMSSIFGQKTFYVGVTRASHMLKIYTDNKQLMRKAVTQVQEKSSALETLENEIVNKQKER